MAKEYPVTIAGKEYKLRYLLSDRPAIEKLSGKNLTQTMFGGELLDQAAVLAVGLKKGYTPRQVVELLEKHQEEGGFYDDVLRPAYHAVLESHLFGRMKDPKAAARLVDEYFAAGIPGEEGSGEEEGKAPATVRAGE